MKFAYRVRDKQGKVSHGSLEAEDKDQLVASLLSQGFYIVALEETKPSSKEFNLDFGMQKVKTRDLVIFTRQLATMMAAGLSIIRSFKILAEQTNNKRLRKAVLQIKEDIENGQALWEAIARHPDVFSRVYISMVKAGELGGVLDSILDRLCTHLEREDEINAKVKAASIYPAIISVFAVIVVFFIISFIMPTFVSMFQSSGVELPAPTRILLGIGLFLKKQVIWLIVGVFVLVYMLKKWGKTDAGGLLFDGILLHLPVVGATVSRIIVARFARTMGTLVRSGIPVLQALEVVEDVVGNAVVSRAIRNATASITEGQSISVPLVETGVFEPMVTQMIAVGEETGSLDEMLIRMSDYYEREVMYSVDTMMAVIEPLMIMVVAILVGGVVIATIMPIFDMANLVGG